MHSHGVATWQLTVKSSNFWPSFTSNGHNSPTNHSFLYIIFANLSITFSGISLAYCPPQTTTFTRGSYSWLEISAEESHTIPCEYGGVQGVQNPVVLRRCDARGIWEDPVISNCLTFVTSSLQNITRVSSWCTWSWSTKKYHDVPCLRVSMCHCFITFSS